MKCESCNRDLFEHELKPRPLPGKGVTGRFCDTCCLEAKRKEIGPSFGKRDHNG